MRRVRGSALAAVTVAILLFTAASSTLAGTITYRLKKGEGFSDVARKYNVPLGTLVRMNRSRLPRPNDPNYVFTGMTVIVPVKDAPPAATKREAKQGPPTPKPAIKPPDKSAPAAQTAKAPSREAPPKTSPAPKSEPEKKPSPPPVAKKHTDNGHASPANGKAEPESDAIFPPEKTITTMSREARSRLERVTGMRWDAAQVLIAGLLLASIALLVWIALAIRRRTRVQDAPDAGDLVLVAARDLGKNTRFFWFKASEKDVFVVTGAEAQVIADASQQGAPDAAPPAAAAPEPVTAASATPAGSRRPRKASPEPPASSSEESAKQ